MRARNLFDAMESRWRIPGGAVVIAGFLLAVAAAPPAWSANPMGYTLLTPEAAQALPHNHGALGLEVDRANQITDGGMTFDIIRIKAVKPDSAGATAGLKAGDQIIALDGRVFPTLDTFAEYVGSLSPGSHITVDYMPAGGGPAQARRIPLTVGQAG